MNAPVIGPLINESPLWRTYLNRIYYWWLRQRRKLPYLVWYNDELDVIVTLSQDKLQPVEMHEGDDQAKAFKQLFSGSFYEVERKFYEMGITFDTGVGFEGRDWEWDFSLKGPISVRFKSWATKPELRKERPRPTLVVSNQGFTGL